MDKQFCVISHTHWDREWYKPFEVFRTRLVDLMDNLLDTIENYPEFVFHLDAQTIVLDDYFAIRPHKREIVKKCIQNGNILVGPWYVQNDFYLTSGEATIRNILIGIDMANEMGRCERIGYMPDQFGLISQLPQILMGFDINNSIFGRGYNPNIFTPIESRNEFEKHKPAEFLWEGPDGTQIISINMPFWYANAQRFSEDTYKSYKLLGMIEDKFKGVAGTPYLLLMNGVDHLEAQENLLPILENLNKELPEGKMIEQTTMQKYIDDVDAYCKENNIDLNVFKGELRDGGDGDVLHATLSARIYLKTQNAKAQNLLENAIEPLYSYISMLGAKEKYPKDFMKYLWKLLIENHPHDSICGCSKDEVHRHMEDRTERFFETGNEILTRGMDFITAHVDRSDLTENDYLISVFNTLQTERTGNVYVDIEIPSEEEIKDFVIVNEKGEEAEFEILSYCLDQKAINSPINLPGVIEVDHYKIRLYVDKLDAFAVRTYVVKATDKAMDKTVDCACSLNKENVLENDYLKVKINNNGQIDLLYKETGKEYKDILVLEDCEDCGDSYRYVASENGFAITSDDFTPSIECIYSTPFETKYKMSYVLSLPKYYDRKRDRRSATYIDNKVDIFFTLEKASKWVNIDFKIDNKSKDHRLRALVKTDIATDYSKSMSVFDIVNRDRNNIYIEKGYQSGIVPNSGFVDIADENEGVAIFNEGIYEYNHLRDRDGVIAMTLLRANSRISGGAQSDDYQTPENQCIRIIDLNMALYPHKGNEIEAKCPEYMKEFQNKLLAYFQPVDVKKYTGGRPAVQDSEIKEIFFRKDKFSYVTIPKMVKLFDLEGTGVMQSAVKKAEYDDSIILRVVNLSDQDSSFKYSFNADVKKVEVVNLEEKVISEIKVIDNVTEDIKITAKQIFTLKVTI